MKHTLEISNSELGEVHTVEIGKGALGEVAQWRLAMVHLVRCTEEIGNGALGKVPHWRLVNVAPRCLVAGAQ